MKRATKIVLITTALLTATGFAIASQGHEGDQHGDKHVMDSHDNKQGKHQMQGMKGMHKNHHAMNSKQFGTKGSDDQLNNLSKDQHSKGEEKHSHN